MLCLSMLLSVGPVLGAANGSNGNTSNGNGPTSGGSGTSGNVKVHDAETGAETSGTDNEPHVCAFWLEFTLDAPFEAGTWVVVSWAPTGDGSTVASGLYDTAGDGVDSSSVIEVIAGHYRVEWAATGATSSKKKTFWVDADCAGPATPAAEESQAEEAAPPTDAPGSPAEEESQAEDEPATDELVLAEQETAPSDEASRIEEVAPTEDEATPPTDEPVVEDATASTDASDEEQPAQDQLGGTGTSDEPTMPDTATPTVPAPSGVLAIIGLVVLILIIATARRDRRSDRENVGSDT